MHELLLHDCNFDQSGIISCTMILLNAETSSSIIMPLAQFQDKVLEELTER